jgi:hypothetical protein
LNQDLVDRTHGRWPWVAAGAAVPSTLVLAACRRSLGEDVRWAFWAPLPIYFWHQTEEWVWPGGFLPFFNREVLHGSEDEFPITRTLGLVINAGLGWGLACVAGLRGLRSPALGAAVLGMLVGNAAMHLQITARRRRYTPGVATSLALLGPVGVAGIVAIARDPRGGARAAGLGAALGLGSGGVMFSAFGRRLRRRRG